MRTYAGIRAARCGGYPFVCPFPQLGGPLSAQMGPCGSQLLLQTFWTLPPSSLWRALLQERTPLSYCRALILAPDWELVPSTPCPTLALALTFLPVWIAFDVVHSLCCLSMPVRQCVQCHGTCRSGGLGCTDVHRLGCTDVRPLMALISHSLSLQEEGGRGKAELPVRRLWYPDRPW